jgi:hypothetical protein
MKNSRDLPARVGNGVTAITHLPSQPPRHLAISEDGFDGVVPEVMPVQVFRKLYVVNCPEASSGISSSGDDDEAYDRPLIAICSK